MRLSFGIRSGMLKHFHFARIYRVYRVHCTLPAHKHKKNEDKNQQKPVTQSVCWLTECKFFWNISFRKLATKTCVLNIYSVSPFNVHMRTVSYTHRANSMWACLTTSLNSTSNDVCEWFSESGSRLNFQKVIRSQWIYIEIGGKKLFIQNGIIQCGAHAVSGVRAGFFLTSSQKFYWCSSDSAYVKILLKFKIDFNIIPAINAFFHWNDIMSTGMESVFWSSFFFCYCRCNLIYMCSVRCALSFAVLNFYSYKWQIESNAIKLRLEMWYINKYTRLLVLCAVDVEIKMEKLNRIHSIRKWSNFVSLTCLFVNWIRKSMNGLKVGSIDLVSGFCNVP